MECSGAARGLFDWLYAYRRKTGRPGGGDARPGVLRSARPSEAAYSRLLALILASVVDASASSRIAVLATSLLAGRCVIVGAAGGWNSTFFKRML